MSALHFGSSNCQILTDQPFLCEDFVSSAVGEATITFFGQGSLIEVEGMPYCRPVKQADENGESFTSEMLVQSGVTHTGGEEEPGTRQAIGDFTWKSRREMRRWIARLRRDARPVFVTLTIPLVCEATPQQAKEWLRVMIQDMERCYDGLSVMWKMEPQQNGSPHFHLFAWGTDFIPWQTVAVRWSEIVLGENLPDEISAPVYRGKAGARIFREWVAKLRDAGTISGNFYTMVQACGRVEAIRTRNGVSNYLTNYMSKDIEECDQQELWAKPGRWWGIQGRDNLPVSKITRIHVSQKAASRFARVMRHWLRARMKGRKLKHVRRVFSDAHVEFLRALLWAEGEYVPRDGSDEKESRSQNTAPATG